MNIGDLEQREYEHIVINGVEFFNAKVQNLSKNVLIIGKDKFNEIVKREYQNNIVCTIYIRGMQWNIYY